MATKAQAENAFESELNYSPRTSTLFGAFAGVAVFGWVVSTFLSGIHFYAIPRIPEGTEITGNWLVVTSEWAYVLGIPLATLGAGYYLTTTVLAGLWFETRHPLVIKILTPITATGVLASAYFVYLQVGPIGAICPFCLMSAAASTVLFGLELAILRTNELPSTSTLLDDAGGLFDSTTLTWPVLVLAMSLLAIGAFFGATLPPIPGT